MKFADLFKIKSKANSRVSKKFGDELDAYTREAFDIAKNNISFVLPNKNEAKTVGISSACPHDGKSSVSINFSYTLAKAGSKVLLIDADMRSPAVSEYLDLKGNKGLSDILATEAELQLYKNILTDGLDVLGAGSIPPNPSELLASDAMVKLISKINKSYDYVIIDLPPINSVTAPVALSKYLDGIILVARHGATKKRELAKAVKELEASGVKILGFIYNAYKKGFCRHRVSKK